MIKIRLNGEDYTTFDSVAVFRSMEDASGAFSMKSSADKNSLFPIKQGDAIQAIVDDVQVLDGFVEVLRVPYGAGTHDITVAGRDKLADLIDSSVFGTKEFTGSVSLIDIARNVLDGLGLDGIQVIDKTGGVEVFDETDITSAEVGQNAFEFIEKFARKRQVLWTTDGIGNLIATRAATTLFPGRLKNILNGDDNNIISAELTLDWTKRFNQYVAESQLNPLNQVLGITPEDISGQSGTATDGAIRATRILEFNTEESNDSLTAGERSKWEANIRRARSIRYSPVVQGHSINGQVWAPNTLVPVEDVFADISATMLVRSVAYNQTLDQGSTTALELTYKDAYTLQAEQDERAANTDEQAFGFIS